MRAGLGSTAGKAKDPSAPSPSIRGEPKRRPRAPPALPGERPRVGEAFPPRAARGSDSKGPGRRGTDAKPPTPSWGFPFHHRLVCTGLGEEAGAPPPRRAGRGRSREPEQGHLRRWERRRPAKDTAYNRRSWEEGEAVRVGEGSRTGAGDRTPPGAPTPPRHRRSRPGFDYTAAPT
jgi:hypothetical protein